MPTAPRSSTALTGFLDQTRAAVEAADALLQDATAKLRSRVVVDGRNVLDRKSLTDHGFQYIGMGI